MCIVNDHGKEDDGDNQGQDEYLSDAGVTLHFIVAIKLDVESYKTDGHRYHDKQHQDQTNDFDLQIPSQNLVIVKVCFQGGKDNVCRNVNDGHREPEATSSACKLGDISEEEVNLQDDLEPGLQMYVYDISYVADTKEHQLQENMYDGIDQGQLWGASIEDIHDINTKDGQREKQIDPKHGQEPFVQLISSFAMIHHQLAHQKRLYG